MKMKDTKDMVNAWNQSGIVGKFIIGFVIIVIAFLIYTTINAERLLYSIAEQNANIEILIKEQAELKKFKKCVKKELDETNDFYINELLPAIGKILQQNNVPFPQELNLSFMKFREHFQKIYNCLIFPEELE